MWDPQETVLGGQRGSLQVVGSCDVVGKNEGPATSQPGFESASHFLAG